MMGNNGAQQQYYSLYYYADKGDGPMAEIKTNQFIGSHKKRVQRFHDMLSDYPELLDKFEASDDYGFKSIQKTVTEYNEFFSKDKTYFINLKGDTTFCKIADRIAAAQSKDSLAYKTPTATRFKALDLDSVKEYTTGGTLIARRMLPGETFTKLVIWIERGKLNFYQYISPKNTKSWYASKADGPLVLVKGKGRGKPQIQALADLISDYPELLEQYKNYFDYTPDLLQLTVATYNKMKKV